MTYSKLERKLKSLIIFINTIIPERVTVNNGLNGYEWFHKSLCFK